MVAGGKIFIGTNNGGARIKRFSADVDLGCLLCFQEANGEFLWQHSNEKLPSPEDNDWPFAGVCSTPLVERDRLWYVTNRCELICLDVDGFRDGENDGPIQDEPTRGNYEADLVWKLDMRELMGVWPHNMSSSSVTAVGRRLFVCTSNGPNESHSRVPAPDAPSFMAVDKVSGDVLWTDNSPSGALIHGQWSSPAAVEVDGVLQVIFGGGDGVLYSFDGAGDGNGRSKLLWAFDCNPKPQDAIGSGRPAPIVSTPVVCDNLVYAAVGEDPEHSGGGGHLWCIALDRRGEVSTQVVTDAHGKVRRLARGDARAIVPARGDRVIANPNSAAVWHYSEFDVNGDGVIDDCLERMHHTISSPVISNGLLVIPDSSGVVHCLSAKEGQTLWTHDLFSPVWSSPLAVDNRVFICSEDGNVSIFELASKKMLLSAVRMPDAIFSTPVATADGLFLATKTTLWAIVAGKRGATQP